MGIVQIAIFKTSGLQPDNKKRITLESNAFDMD